MSQRVFMHIDEYGNAGFRRLPHFVCVSDPVVLWSPSALLLDSARDAGATDLTAKDLIRLIELENAPVRIVAREPWFDRTWRNLHPFPGARWVPGYDDTLARFAEQDKTLAPQHRRVIVAGCERGYAKADELLRGPRKQSLEAKIGRLFRDGHLPAGTLEKARRDIAAKRPYVRTIVRDCFNHVDATSDARAAVAATPCEHLLLLAELVAGTRATALTVSDDQRASADAADVREASRVLGGLRPSVTKKHLFKFMRSSLRRDLLDLLYSERGTKSLEHHLAAQMQRSVDVPTFLSRFLGQRDPVGLAVTLGGLALALATVGLTGQFSVGLLPVAVAALKGPAMQHGLLPAPLPYGDKTRALFYLVLGTRRPTIERIKALCGGREEDTSVG